MTSGGLDEEVERTHSDAVEQVIALLPRALQGYDDVEGLLRVLADIMDAWRDQLHENHAEDVGNALRSLADWVDGPEQGVGARAKRVRIER